MASRTALPVFCLLLTVGCFEPGKGIEPPTQQPYFPVGVAVSPTRSYLYLVSSDYDLQYTGGVLQVLDLARVRELVPDPEGGCGDLGAHSAAERLNVPTRCGYVDLAAPQDGGAPLLVDVTKIGAFATDVLFRQRPDAVERGGDEGRLFIPVRGDATLHYIDVEAGGQLECGQDGNEGRCSDRYRVGDDPEEENTRDLRLPPEPFAIDATPSSAVAAEKMAVLVTHQADGNVSLFVNDWGRDQGPSLEFVASDLGGRAAGIAALPVPELVRHYESQPTLGGSPVAAALYDPGFLITFRDSPEVRLLRYYAESSVPPRPFIQDLGAASIMANSVGSDSRGVGVDDSERRECEATCTIEAEKVKCLEDCIKNNPLGVFVANRAPASLLVGRSRPIDNIIPTDELPYFYDSVPLPLGVSRVIVGEVIDRGGLRQPRVFIVCFDQRKIAIYDPRSRMIEKFVDTGRGPHAFAVDVDPSASPAGALGYVAHFSDSWVGVIDLDQRNTKTYGTLVLAVGRPTPPRGSK